MFFWTFLQIAIDPLSTFPFMYHSLCYCFCAFVSKISTYLCFCPKISPPCLPMCLNFPLGVSLCVDRLVSHFLSFPSESFPRTVDCDHTNFPSNAHLLLGVSTQKCFYDLLSARLRIGKIFLTNYLIESNGRVREPWV